ncbi:MAG: flagellar export protein FliJ [Pseudomonadota bacterium]
MSKANRFQPVQRLNQSREESAARALGNSNQAVEAQEQRLRELEHYREEYQRYVHERGSAGVSAGKLQELRRFLGNLNLAIEQQRQMLEQARQEREHKRRSWQQAHGESQALNKVVERYRRDEQSAANKREQKEIDEHAQRGRR